ncbi:MAG: addiction module protein [Bacteroidales bacterium]
MKQFSVEVNDDKVGFFIELMKSLRFVRVKEVARTYDLTQVQKDELDRRVEEYNQDPTKFPDWDKVCNKIEKGL